MSLAVDDGGRGGRARSRSRSRDRRPRDEEPREPPVTYADVREPSYVYPEDDLDERYKSSRRSDAPRASNGALPYPSEGGIDHMLPGSQSMYSYDDSRTTYRTLSPAPESPYKSSRDKFEDVPYRSSRDKGESQLPGSFPEEDRRHDDRRRSDRGGRDDRDEDDKPRPRYSEGRDYKSGNRDSYRGRSDDEAPRIRNAEPPSGRYDAKPALDEDKLKFLPQKYSRKYTEEEDPRSSNRSVRDRDRDSDRDTKADRRRRKDAEDEDNLAYGRAPPRSPRAESPETYGSYITRSQWEDKQTSKAAPRDSGPPRRRPASPSVDEYGASRSSLRDSLRDDPRGSGASILSVDPSSRSRRDKSPGPSARDRDDPRSSGASVLNVDPSSRSRRDRSPGPSVRERDDPRGSGASVLNVDPSSRSRRDRSPGPSARDDPRGSGSSVLNVEPSGRGRRDRSPGPSVRDDPCGSGASVLTVDPSSRGRRDKSPGPSALAEPSRRDRDRSADRRSSMRDRSPNPPARGSTLTVDGPKALGMSVAAAPGSPLLESYHGTYQEISPMPSPLLLASQNPSDDLRILEPLSPLGSDAEGDGKRRSRRARFHDPEDISTRLARALKGDRAPDTEPLIEILPSLTHEQVMELRTEYKRLVKTGADRKGVNVAKHIRARLKDEDPSLMKACYSVALGKWESEAYWANFWYQGDKTRRELLIESLMGRTNDEIREIKDAFTDKKYDNSLAKCMKMELKEDKFKKAVLMVLDERRMDDFDRQGRRMPPDYDLIDRDVADLRRAVKAEKGGETLMISIVVQRSDAHLRSVLKEYERQYRSNFARDSLKRSGNLVGEVLAHILNGVINRPVRDALLLHHALASSRKDELRRELLISRLVRFHWDPLHMRAIKKAYRERYGQDLQEAVREGTSGKWGMFCAELCIARMPDDVRRMERVEIIR